MKKSEVPKQPAFRQADVIASFVLSCVAVSKSRQEEFKGFAPNSPHKAHLIILESNDGSKSIILDGREEVLPQRPVPLAKYKKGREDFGIEGLT